MTGRIRRHPFVAGVLGAGLVLGGIWVAKLVQLARSSSTCAAYWSQPQGEAGGLLYVALGDSAAQGIGASDPQHGYVALLAARLRQASGRPVEVVNLSSSGACIGDVLDDQVPALDALSRTPDIVTVAVGGNDVRAYGRATFAAQAEQLAAALPDGAYVADAPYFMHGRWERDAAEAGGLLRQAAQSEGLRPAGLHRAQQAQGWQAMFTSFAADWFHPNDRGHRVWADAFWQEMAEDAVGL